MRISKIVLLGLLAIGVFPCHGMDSVGPLPLSSYGENETAGSESSNDTAVNKLKKMYRKSPYQSLVKILLKAGLLTYLTKYDQKFLCRPMKSVAISYLGFDLLNDFAYLGLQSKWLSSSSLINDFLIMVKKSSSILKKYAPIFLLSSEVLDHAPKLPVAGNHIKKVFDRKETKRVAQVVSAALLHKVSGELCRKVFQKTV